MNPYHTLIFLITHLFFFLHTYFFYYTLIVFITHLALKFTKWGPKKSEDGANGDRLLFKYCILFQVWHDHKVPVFVRLSASDLCMVGTKI